MCPLSDCIQVARDWSYISGCVMDADQVHFILRAPRMASLREMFRELNENTINDIVPIIDFIYVGSCCLLTRNERYRIYLSYISGRLSSNLRISERVLLTSSKSGRKIQNHENAFEATSSWRAPTKFSVKDLLFFAGLRLNLPKRIDDLRVAVQHIRFSVVISRTWRPGKEELILESATSANQVPKLWPGNDVIVRCGADHQFAAWIARDLNPSNWNSLIHFNSPAMR